jgi:hypothetical protein
MARGVSAEDRRGPVTIIENDGTPPDDVDDSFDNWRDSLRDGQIPGKVTAYQIPMDDNGVPQPSAKNQIRLGAWPVDAYDFDQLCDLLIRQYMTPEKILCVRLMGTKAGTAGLQFNKVVTLRAPNNPDPKTVNGQPVPESTATIMRAINENNAALIAQFKAMLPAAPVRDPNDEVERMLRISALINAPNAKLMELLIPALVGRPVPAADNTFSQLSGLVDVFGKLQDLRGGGEGGGGDGDDSVAGIIRSLVPVVRPALEAIPAIAAMRPQIAAPARAQPQLPPNARPQGAPPGSVPTQQPTAAAPAPGNLTDIPSGDEAMFRELKPQIDTLVEMAGQGSDADGAADLLFDQVIMGLPDEYYEKIGDLIGGPNFVTQAAVFNPKVNAHADWFKKFQARIVARYEAEDTAASTAPTPAA